MSNISDTDERLKVSVGLCPVCETVLRCERRGDEWFAWCSQGPFNIGCSGMSAFGEDRPTACANVHAIFNDL